MASLKAVLFDMDDTLIDWSQFDGDYYNLELEHFTWLRDYIIGQGCDLPHVDTLLADFRGRAMDGWDHGRETMVAPHLPRILTGLLRDFGVPDELLDEDAIIKAYAWNAVEGVTVFPEVPGTLQKLLDAGVKLGIVTNAFQPMIMRDNELNDHGLLGYFESCRYAAADVGYLKPHPTIFETALDCIGTKPAETVFVGDSLTADIAGSQRVGMKAVWRDTGHHPSRLAIEAIKPDARIIALDQLLDQLDRWYPGWR
jgi:putative hydrolase of the HAD superfamily